MCALHEDKRFDELVASLGLDPERVVGLELRLHKDEITTAKIEELVYDDQLEDFKRVFRKLKLMEM